MAGVAVVVRLRKEASLLDVYAAVACARAVLPLVEHMVAGRTAELPARREEKIGSSTRPTGSSTRSAATCRGG